MDRLLRPADIVTRLDVNEVHLRLLDLCTAKDPAGPWDPPFRMRHEVDVFWLSPSFGRKPWLRRPYYEIRLVMNREHALTRVHVSFRLSAVFQFTILVLACLAVLGSVKSVSMLTSHPKPTFQDFTAWLMPATMLCVLGMWLVNRRKTWLSLLAAALDRLPDEHSTSTSPH